MEVREQVYEIFREVFENDSLAISDTTSAKDIRDWDSLANINLVVAMEKQFGVKFAIQEIMPLQNVGDMIQLIEKKKKSRE